MNTNFEELYFSVKGKVKDKLKNKKTKRLAVIFASIAFVFIAFSSTMSFLITTKTITVPNYIEALFLDGGKYKHRNENGFIGEGYSYYGENGEGGNDIAVFAPTTAVVTASVVLGVAIVSSTCLYIFYKKNMVDTIESLPILYHGGEKDDEEK